MWHFQERSAGSDLFQIKTERTYPGSHQALIDAAKEEKKEDVKQIEVK
nr:hypothetical protein [uncultured Prevotella sp.]